jgi:hypothetical protein
MAGQNNLPICHEVPIIHDVPMNHDVPHVRDGTVIHGLPLIITALLASIVAVLVLYHQRHLRATPPPSDRPRKLSTEGTVISLSCSHDHLFSKSPQASISLIPNLGIQGDAHLGSTVQHRSRLHIRPPPANLRQVHLLHAEILDQVDVKPGQLGENITTRGLDLLGLGGGTRLWFVPAREGKGSDDDGTDEEPRKEDLAESPCVRITGLRNPCAQINTFRAGLQEKFIERDAQTGEIIKRKAGVMGVVEAGGEVTVGMRILVEKVADGEWKALEPV